MTDETTTPTADAPDTASGIGTAQVVLKPRKVKPFVGRHPWVLASAVARVEGTAEDGDVVELVDQRGKLIARGIYNSQSRIRVRLYSWGRVEPLDDAFWRRHLESAVEHRRNLGYLDPAGGCRVVYSEADGLSGLIVDRYGHYLCVQVTAQAMAVRLEKLVPMLAELLSPRGVLVRTEKGINQAEGLELRDGLYWGNAPDGPVFVEEHGLRYGVDLAEGQKTGFYLDQRENRKAAAAYVRGRRVLDMFCYSGAFALCASRLGQAREVLGVDTSEKAVALARANAELNGVSNTSFEAGDCFETLDRLVAEEQKFGAVFLDPPKFARSRGAVNDALKAYHRINRRAVDLLEPGGILVTSSCSGHVTREDLMLMLSGVSQRTGREIQVLEQRGAAADHPVSATCLESEYLKCFVCRVI